MIPATDPANAPTEPGVPASEGATEVTTVDLTEGDGATPEAGQTAVLQYVMFRGDNGVQIDSTWDTRPDPGADDGGNVRRAARRPRRHEGRRPPRRSRSRPTKGFGPEGSPTIGLPADTDVIMVVDLLGVY